MEIPEIIFLESIDSTNSYAKNQFDLLKDGTVIAAGEQTAGRGRMGRRWFSPAGENLYVSMVMKRIHDPFLANAAASLAVLTTLRNFAPDFHFYLKWPNDVYTGMNKVCGILSEGVLAPGGEGFSGMIAGMGVNVNSSPETLDEIGGASSLRSLCGKYFNLKEVLSFLCGELSMCYETYQARPQQLFRQWKKENQLIGRTLEFLKPSGEKFCAELHDISDTGEAVILKDGKTEIFNCGDLRILRNTWDMPVTDKSIR